MTETCVEELPARLDTPTPGQVRTYLLTGGIARCGVCTQPLEAKPAAAVHGCSHCDAPLNRRHKTPTGLTPGIRLRDITPETVCPACHETLIPKQLRPGSRGYACTKTAPHPGCGRVRIAADGLEEHVAVQVLARFAEPDNLAWLSGLASASAQTGSALAVQIGQTEQLLEKLGRDHVAGRIGETAFYGAETEGERLLKDLRAQAQIAAVLSDFPAIATVDDLADWWKAPERTVQERHDLVRIVIKEIRIMPSRRLGFHGFDRARVECVWATI